ncbi:ABC transporter ATP-binding protein [Aureibaculum sp. 2210JD6-5]|uniref:ABC transporter ATP-binding protein n=1 Tax=Aureibaculum sp. 2210JD6-5 TaxID=3103957 RepID=UPI002AACA0C5|nr:ABC transporter ATP-binding protein [Aureibaculum sp. 2210JD6-5]MDY7395780.1 ABC transporter ATP-binding protein [Aureibaculum sp. 2210JD6-5]
MLQVINISFSYHKTPVLQNISFNVKKGDVLAVVGESGSGKSTLLKLLYGEYDLNEGQLLWNDKEILGPKFNLITGPEYIKFLSQEFDLMPSTTVEKNIGEFLSNFYLKEKKRRTEELIKVVELEAFAKTKVRFLSGGQKQRVALAKALAKQPEVLLLDEPFSHIDNFRKRSLRRKLFAHLKENNITTIVATHDQEDVLSFADNMLVIHDGKKVEMDTPQQLFTNPKNSLTASFFSEFNEFKISEISNSNKNDTVIIYAHELELVKNSDLKVTVKKSYFKGNYYLVEADFKGRNIYFENDKKLEENQKIYLEIDNRNIAQRLT